MEIIINFLTEIAVDVGIIIKDNVFNIMFFGSIITGIAILVKNVLKHQREKYKDLKKERKKAYKKIENVLSGLYKKNETTITSQIHCNDLSFDEWYEISKNIVELFNKDVKLFIDTSNLLSDKAQNAIKQKIYNYRNHTFLEEKRIQEKFIVPNKLKSITEARKILSQAKEEKGKASIFVKEQFNLYLLVNKQIYNEYQVAKKLLSKKLGKI